MEATSSRDRPRDATHLGRAFMRSIRFWRWRRDHDSDVARELDVHLTLEIESQLEAGKSPKDATDAARRALGNVTLIKEELRDMQRGALTERIWQDLRYAARILRKDSLFTLSAVFVLALGIGATTAVFSLVDAVIFRPLAFPESDQLVMLWDRSERSARGPVATLDFVDWKEQNTTFAGLAGTAAPIEVPLSDETGAPPGTAVLQSVTGTYFEVLGIPPILGRTFAHHDDVETQQGAVGVVISERLWRSTFGADPNVVGQTIRTGSPPNARAVLGVVPSKFSLLTAVDVWEHLAVSRTNAQRGQGILQVIGRMKAGTDIVQARADMNVVTRNIERIAPATNRGRSATVEPLRNAIVGEDLRTTSLVLGAIVLFVLLLACANVANLTLARGVARRREMAVRAALGGTRGRIVRQLLTESALLGLLGGLAGLAVAWLLLRVAPFVLPDQMIPHAIVIGMNWRLGAFAFVMTLVTALLFGAAPAWQAASIPLTEAMTAGGRGSSDRGSRLRQTLVVIEIAAALVLLTGATLLVRTLLSLDHVDAGYRAENVITLSVRLPFRSLMTARPGELARYWQSIESAVAGVPGVRLASLGSNVPLRQTSLAQEMPFHVVGAPEVDVPIRPKAQHQVVTANYFAALGVPVLRGRAFSERDAADSIQVAIVNEEFVRKHLAGRDPIGARITIQNPLTFRSLPVTREVVGVVPQLKSRPEDPAENVLQVFVPLSQNNWLAPTLVVRTDQDPVRLVPQIKAAIAQVDPTQAVFRVRTMEAVAAEATARPRFRAQLVTAFATVATVLAAVGIFSILTFIVKQRAREFGIRLAIGAGPSDLVRLVLSNGLRLVVIGLVLGLGISALLARFLEVFLFGVAALDLVTFLAAPALLTLVALLACLLPAISVLRADAVRSLQAD